MTMALATMPAQASRPPAETGVIGTWSTPQGAIVGVARCGTEVCITILTVSANAPETQDKKNPDAALRSRPLCGLRIGTGFHLNDPSHATNGKLYDPTSGNTYDGKMTASGDSLELRGYMHIELFGRNEEWKRAPAPAAPCSAK